MAYQHTNSKGTKYYLNSREITLRGSGKTQRIFFFSRDERNETGIEMPDGYQVVESKKTGLPVLKKS